MVDGAALAVRPRTEVRIDQYSYERKPKKDRSFFSLVRGTFRAITGLIGRNNRESYKVRTATATIGIRGSDGLIGHNPATGLTAVRTFDGGHSLTAPNKNGDPVTVQVNAGQIAIARPGQAPTFATTFPSPLAPHHLRKRATSSRAAVMTAMNNRPLNRVMVNRLYKRAIQTSGTAQETHSPIPEAQSPASQQPHISGGIAITNEVQQEAGGNDGFPPPGSVLASANVGAVGAYIRIDPIADITPEAGALVAIVLMPQFSSPGPETAVSPYRGA